MGNFSTKIDREAGRDWGLFDWSHFIHSNVKLSYFGKRTMFRRGREREREREVTVNNDKRKVGALRLDKIANAI